MTTPEYFPPTLGQSAYHCPFCHVYASQHYAHLHSLVRFHWSSVVDRQTVFDEPLPSAWIVTKCQRCENVAFWHESKLVFPRVNSAPPANRDLSDEIRADYDEAASVVNDSPRAAAALLRLALQKLCRQLGEKGENINDDIKSLVSKGLNPLVQKSLDALRITGNNAVHPGEINLQEEPDRVFKLFGLINFIASKMITEPKEIETFYGALPANAIKAVERRDKKDK